MWLYIDIDDTKMLNNFNIVIAYKVGDNYR